MPFFLIICTSFYQNISLWIARDGEAKSRCAIWNGPFWFELQFDILFLGTTSLRWIDYIFSLALRFIYNYRGDFIFWRFWSFFLWSHEISTKLGHISFEEYAEAPSIHLFNMKVFIGWNFPISNIWMAFVPICATSSAKRIRHSTFASNSFINEK